VPAFAQTNEAGMNTDAKSNRMSAGSRRIAMSLNIPGRNASALSMILISARPAEYRNTAVAGIVYDLSPDAFH
jgi:hypothetical protein